MGEPPRRRDERGTTLLLFPAAVLVLLLLAAIAVDLSQVHMARRELERVAAQAADDAAAMVDRSEVHRTGRTRIDHAAADRVVRFELTVAHLHGRLVGRPDVSVDDATGTVTVVTSAEVDPVFGTVVGRGPQRVTVRVSGRLLDAK